MPWTSAVHAPAANSRLIGPSRHSRTIFVYSAKQALSQQAAREQPLKTLCGGMILMPGFLTCWTQYLAKCLQAANRTRQIGHRAERGNSHHPVAAGETKFGKCLQCQLLFGTGADARLDQPFFNIGSDHVWMILLEVVQAGTKLHHPAVFETLRKVLCKGRRDQSAWIANKKQLWIRRLRQRLVGFLDSRIHIGRLPLDRQLIREAPGGPP